MSVCGNSNRFRWLVITFFMLASNHLMMIRHCGAQQQQYFRLKPRNVTVHEGGEALLECEIVHLAGAVQWAKDGFALGFDPVIPAKPRYMVIEDRRHGGYSLRITNVSLEDDGEFQCQVGPMKSNKAIRANARLSVISPPSHVEIVNYSPNAKIEVNESSNLNLECVARNSRPPAQIIWYRGNVPVNTDSVQVQIQENVDNQGIRRFDVRRKITIKPTSGDDHAKYTCEASHDALFDHPLRTTVQLSVLYPPSAPIIEGYAEGEVIKRGQIVELLCRSRNGNPPPQLTWYKNNTQIRVTHRSYENLITFSAAANDDKSSYRCDSQHKLTTKILKAEVTLTVLFSPSSITIAGPTEAKVGEQISLTCKTANSNPPAEIKCTVAGRELKTIVSKVSPSQDGGWLTTANISLVIEQNIKSFVVICHALNRQLNENIVGTHTVNVLHKPNPPIIEGYIPGTILLAGATQKLLCISSGGNPLATLNWFKNDQRIESALLSSTDKSVSSELTIVINASDNDAVYRCEAANAAINSPLFDTVSLNVRFPAERIKIRLEPEILKPNIMAKLICESSSSSPPSRLSWWHDNVPFLGVNETIESGDYGGKTTKIEISLNVSEKSNDDVYTCQANNEVLQKSIHESIRLQVFYKPVVESSNKMFTGLENNSLLINFNVHANPDKISFTWTKDGLPIASYPNTGRIISNGPILNITKLSRNDIGVYVCEALNSQGRTLIHFDVNVEYPAQIIAISERIIADEMSEVKFTCTADGNPFDGTMISWKRDNFTDFDSRTAIEYHVVNHTSILTLKRVQKSDLGSFQCTVTNGLGPVSTRQAFLLVKHKPEIDMSLIFTKSAVDIGEIGRLICRTNSFPVPRYVWSRSSLPITTNTTGKYFTEFKQIDEFTSESVLIVMYASSSDYGNYECVARNDFGFTTMSLSLQALSIPDVPDKLYASNVTYDSISLHWTPPFNGGLPLLYTIRYRIATDSEYNYDHVIEHDSMNFTLYNLNPNTEYLISISARNKLGYSNYLKDLLRVKTSNNIPHSYHSSSSSAEKLPAKVSSLLILLSSVVGTVLLLLNAMLIGCCLRRRSKRLSKGPLQSEVMGFYLFDEQFFIDEKFLRIFIASIISLLFCFVVFNLGLLIYCLWKRKLKAEHSKKSNKAATIEMYAPSSFNETVTGGETLSSVSEKSENLSPIGSRHEHLDDERKYTAKSTYLTDQPDFSKSYQLMSNCDNQRTRTLPHLHNHGKFQCRSKSKDDLNLNNYSARSTFTASPSPAPPTDGSYFNMAEYISYPPSLELQQPCSTLPNQKTIDNNSSHNTSQYQQNHIIYPQYPISNSTLLRHQHHRTAVPPPDVLYGANGGQILQAQSLSMPKRVEFSSFGNGYILSELDNHLV